MEILKFWCFDAEMVDEVVKPKFLDTNKRFVETKDGLAIFAKKSLSLLKKTLNYWDIYKDNKFTFSFELNKDKTLSYTVSGIPNLKDDINLEEWREFTNILLERKRITNLKKHYFMKVIIQKNIITLICAY